MGNSIFAKGTRIKFSLIRPYTQEDIDFGCDPRVNGKEGTIQSIWDLKEMCIIKLDEPLIGYHGEKIYEYWEYTYNMIKISDPDPIDEIDDGINYRKCWKELKKVLITRYNKLSQDTGNSNNMVDYTRLHVVTEILQIMDDLDSNP